METNSERQVNETLTDSLLMDIISPGYLPDISALQVPAGKYQGQYCRTGCTSTVQGQLHVRL